MSLLFLLVISSINCLFSHHCHRIISMYSVYFPFFSYNLIYSCLKYNVHFSSFHFEMNRKISIKMKLIKWAVEERGCMRIIEWKQFVMIEVISCSRVFKSHNWLCVSPSFNDGFWNRSQIFARCLSVNCWVYFS